MKAGDTAISFTHNARSSLGIEVELHLVDQETGELVSASEEILAEMSSGHPGGEHPKAKHELFQSTVEIITGVCATADEAHRDLRATLDELTALAGPRGIVPISSGTHPFSLASTQLVSPNPRYHQLIEDMQWPARRLLICGMHVHVGVESGEQSITVVNELTRHLPLLLALSASSPYFEGEDSGLASARSKVFESLPTAGLPPQIADWLDFEAFMGTLLDTACISSIREVWWDIRPHPDFGTVELRMCDATPTLSEATALAALSQCLVEWTKRHLAAGTLPPAPREWTVRENRWFASRYGLDAEVIVEDVEAGEVSRRRLRDIAVETVAELAPIAVELECTAELDGVLRILEVGSGTERQRRIIREGGTLVDVVHHLAHELADDVPRR